MKQSEYNVLQTLYRFKVYFRKSGGVGLATVTLFSDYSRATVNRNLVSLADAGLIDIELITHKKKNVRLFKINVRGEMLIGRVK